MKELPPKAWPDVYERILVCSAFEKSCSLLLVLVCPLHFEENGVEGRGLWRSKVEL